MSKREKRLSDWKYNTPVDAPKENVEAVLRYYWPKVENKGSSHYVIHDERSNDHEQCHGILSVVIKGGQEVKGFYLQRIVEALEYIGEVEL